MENHCVLQNSQFIIIIITILLAMLLISVTTMAEFSVSSSLNSYRVQYCGNINISFPFGVSENTSLNEDFQITCDETTSPPRAFFKDTNVEVTDIYLDGRVRILNFVAHSCYKSGVKVYGNNTWFRSSPTFFVNNVVNRFTIVGCDAYGFASGRRLERNFSTSCDAWCGEKDDLLEGSCSGLGCCQVSIPRDAWYVDLELNSYDNYTNLESFTNCSHGFIVEEDAFKFYPDNLTNLNDVTRLPMLLDWAIRNDSCEIALRNLSTYACKSTNSMCRNVTNGYGYLCSCGQGYEGNPYILNGCQDVNECSDPARNVCGKQHCRELPGSYQCYCPKGYHENDRDGRRDCFRDPSLIFKLVSGIALGVIALIVVACWIYYELKKRKLIRMKQKFFFQNGGLLLQEKFIGRERSLDTARIFTSTELKKATNNFHSSTILGHGGFGTVYKGILPDKRIVAIKKSKEVDPSQVEQFINEVTILSRISHRNVVRLLGCCLETQVPLLVYEFVDNGTLSESIHNKEKACFLNWEMRLKIACEAAGVLSYLHSAASTPVIHRDVKSANILLDNTFTAKVSDFGASRLVPMDQTQLSTMVQGTFGYLDPEYLQTNQLTEKSDVYSFGVVLVELLTGRKALSYAVPDDERNLANFFLCVLKHDRLCQILEQNIVCEENVDQMVQVAMLAKRCLHVKGEDRPSMKEVAMELEGLRRGVVKETQVYVKNFWQEEDSSPGGSSLVYDPFEASYDCSTQDRKFVTI